MLPFFSEPEHEPFTLGNGRHGALLIHGFPGTPAEMRPLASRLVAADFTAYGPLLPGFGREIPHLGEMDRSDWLHAAGAAWQQVRERHETAVLIGFSMGAAIAVHLAAAHPPDSLVLLAPFWRLGGWQVQLLPLLKHVMKTMRPFAKADFTDPAVRKQMQELVPGANLDDPTVQQALREQIQLPTAVIDEVRRLGQSAFRLAPQIQSPTLVLQGAHDEVVKPAATRRFLTRLGGTLVYHEFPGKHDFVKMTAPQTQGFVTLVRDFISSSPEPQPHLQPAADAHASTHPILPAGQPTAPH